MRMPFLGPVPACFEKVLQECLVHSCKAKFLKFHAEVSPVRKWTHTPRVTVSGGFGKTARRQSPPWRSADSKDSVANEFKDSSGHISDPLKDITSAKFAMRATMETNARNPKVEFKT